MNNTDLIVMLIGAFIIPIVAAMFNLHPYIGYGSFIVAVVFLLVRAALNHGSNIRDEVIDDQFYLGYESDFYTPALQKVFRQTVIVLALFVVVIFFIVFGVDADMEFKMACLVLLFIFVILPFSIYEMVKYWRIRNK